MHPRSNTHVSARTRGKLAQRLLAFVRERGPVHPREVDEHFAVGTVVNYWGGSSSATTHLLEAMHYTGLLRVARRERGIRIYAPRDAQPPLILSLSKDERTRRVDALVDAVMHTYAPLPAKSLMTFVRRLRYAVPQWTGELTAALHRARQRFAHAQVDGTDWYW